MMRETDKLAITQLAEQRHVTFTDRTARVAFPGQSFGIAEQVVRRYIFMNGLSEDYATLFLNFALASKSWRQEWGEFEG